MYHLYNSWVLIKKKKTLEWHGIKLWSSRKAGSYLEGEVVDDGDVQWDRWGKKINQQPNNKLETVAALILVT